MTAKEKELILAWIINEDQRIENELIELRNRIRFRRIDISDCVELELTLQRKADFEEFALILFRLLHLDPDR